MAIFKIFKNIFNKNTLNEIFYNKIKFSNSCGLDRITAINFELNKDKYFDEIINKISDNTYKFIPYKEVLISKGKNKTPRVISIPSIKDKLTLAALYKLLYEAYPLNHKLVQIIISDITTNINKFYYDYLIKLDIKKFYSSINHRILLKIIRKRIRKQQVLSLISKSIKNSTKSSNEIGKNFISNPKGVPEGLSISNLLANIYLDDLDKDVSSNYNCKYYRYVDDILILCNFNNSQTILDYITNKIKLVHKLSINNDKTIFGPISNGFNYLGYQINVNIISVRKSTVHKLEHSIENIFLQMKNSALGLEYLIWKLNLKITGCIKNQKKYGWLFFYSQITDYKLLYHLDWEIKKLIKRFYPQLDTSQLKKFIRSYHEITKNLKNSKYIPNFDNYNLNEKKSLLSNIFKIKINNFSDTQITDLFDLHIFKSIRDLEKDMQDFSK